MGTVETKRKEPPFPEGKPGSPAIWLFRLARVSRSETDGMGDAETGRYFRSSWAAAEAGKRGVTALGDALLSEAIFSGRLSHDARKMRYAIRCALAKLRKREREGVQA